MFKKGTGDWTQYRSLRPNKEIDFHVDHQEHRDVSYDEAMYEIGKMVLDEVKKAYEEGTPYLIFTHGWSTSRPGKTTARSVVRQLMRSTEVTPYIIRKECIQHEAVFVAAIRPKSHKADSPLLNK